MVVVLVLDVGLGRFGSSFAELVGFVVAFAVVDRNTEDSSGSVVVGGTRSESWSARTDAMSSSGTSREVVPLWVCI